MDNRRAPPCGRWRCRWALHRRPGPHGAM